MPRQGHLHEEIPREGALPGAYGGTKEEAQGMTIDSLPISGVLGY